MRRAIGADVNPGLAAFRPPDIDVAVVLNINARRVSRRVRRLVRKAVPEANLYLTQNLEEAEAVTREILDRGVSQIVAGGGDGTVAKLMDTICKVIDEQDNLGQSVPTVRVLKLGTGNALASHVGAGRPAADLKRLDAVEESCALPLHLIEAAGRLSFFAGAGLDAMIVNDYATFKDRSRRRLRFLGEGLPGYLLSAFGWTIPRLCARGRLTNVRVVNLGETGYRLGPDGRSLGQPLVPGEVLYEGPCLAAMAGTLPYYGAGMRMFPWACDRDGFMQLRVGAPSVPHIISQLRRVWRGSYRHPRLHDFHVTHARLEFESPAPIHVAGDAEGWHESLELRISPHVVPLVHLH